MKYFLSSTVGLLTGIVGIYFFELLFLYLLPSPAGIDMQDKNSIAENMDNIPIINFIMLIVGYGIGSFIAGFVSAKIKTHNPLTPVIIIGVILTILGFIYFLTIPHPLWVIVVGSITFIPAVWLGGKVGIPPVRYDSIYKV